MIKWGFILKKYIFFITMIFSLNLVFSQEMQTANDFLRQVEAKYNQIEDMRCRVTMKVDGTTMSGIMTFKRPNYLKVEFTNPANQVLALDGSKLQIYIPSQNVVMVQNIDTTDSSASSDSFSLLRRTYAVSFPSETRDAYVSLDPKNPSSQLVKKLKFAWKQRGSTSIKEMIFSINKENFIVEVDATTDQNKKIVFSMSEFRTNLGMKIADFEYVSPSSSYKMYNFLAE